MLKECFDSSEITGLILAGGRSSRMGGVEKGLQTLRGAPMVSHVAQRLAPQVGKLFLVANRFENAYAHLGFHVLKDARAGFLGPLAGIEAGLIKCQTKFLLCVPCDTPFIPSNLVATLAQALFDTNSDLTYAITEEGENVNMKGRIHPTIALMRSTVTQSLQDFLNAGGRKVQSWHQELNTFPVHFFNNENFANINTIEEITSLNKFTKEQVANEDLR
jgi:molybdenum cofactor guanylyltransferase